MRWFRSILEAMLSAIQILSGGTVRRVTLGVSYLGAPCLECSITFEVPPC